MTPPSKDNPDPRGVAQEVADLLDSLLRIGALNPNLVGAESICNVPRWTGGTITEVIGESQ